VVAPIGRGVKVRPPQPGPAQDAKRRNELLATAAAPPKTQDGEGRTDKNWGS